MTEVFKVNEIDTISKINFSLTTFSTWKLILVFNLEYLSKNMKIILIMSRFPATQIWPRIHGENNGNILLQTNWCTVIWKCFCKIFMYYLQRHETDFYWWRSWWSNAWHHLQDHGHLAFSQEEIIFIICLWGITNLYL